MNMKKSAFDIWSFVLGITVISIGIGIADVLRITGVINAAPIINSTAIGTCTFLVASLIVFVGSISLINFRSAGSSSAKKEPK